MTARFEAKDDGFDLLLGDRVILRHRVDSPAIRIAKGNPTVTMVRGNFRMADAPSEERVLRYMVSRKDRPTSSGLDVEIGLADWAGSPAQLNVQFGFEADDSLTLNIDTPLAGYDRIWVDFLAETNEHVWGGGEQMSYLDLRGRRFPIWTSEPGVGREPGTPLSDAMSADGSFAGGDYWTTNYPEPTFLSSRNYAVRVGNIEHSILDFTEADRHRVEVWSDEANIYIIAADNPAALVRMLSGIEHTPMLALPDWAIGGAIVGLKDGANSFARLEKIIAAGAAVSGLWCEDWVGVRQTSFGRRLFWDWQWNAERYPDLPARIAELKARDIRFLGYVNPYLAVDGPQYAEAARLGYLARKLDSDEPYAVDFGEFDAGVVDFTNDDAAEWFSEEIIGKQMLDFGLDGWMADFGEYLPVDLRLHNGDPMREHNEWPVHWANANWRALKSRGRLGDVLFFMRAGFTHSNRFCPLLWAGDQSVDFSRHDGIGTVITAALSAGLVGNAYSHSDVGGYTSLHGNIRTEELMQRWYELGAFTPVMRTHEGNRPDDNLQIDSTPELLAGFARWSRVHAALAPWVRHLCDEATATGLPAQRALFLHYPDGRETFTIQDQYLYGADLMVAPVIEENAVARKVYLPADDWVHVWSGKRFGSGWHKVDAPIGSPPVFWREGSEYASLFAGLVEIRDSI